MVHKNYSSAVSLALLLTAVSVADVHLVRSQTTAFKLPASVPQGTNVRVDGSSSMAAVNNVLKQRFEQQFPGTQVNVAANGTSAGIQAVSTGQVEVAAIGRPLTDAETAQGLKAVQVGRDKIAILIGANNTFAKSLTIEQFAKMFRGEIKNWSEVGGANIPIKFVDRPDSSDTRQAFREYPVFKQGKFVTGATAVKLNEDTTPAVVASLGNNGISYTTANQTKGLSGAKVVTMHGTRPSDSRYPFSQPLYYVYKDGANPAVQAFLGLATASVGQTAIEKSGAADAIAAKPTAVQKTTAGGKPQTPATTTAKAGTAGSQTLTTPQGGNNAQGGNSQADGGNPLAFLFPGENTSATGTANPATGLPNWLWWLLPIGSGAALLWALAGGRRNRRDRGATGSFNAPGYEDNYSDRGNLAGDAPYVEGGYDPMHGNSDFSTDVSTPVDASNLDLDLDRNAEIAQPSNLDLEPNTRRGFERQTPIEGNIGGAALAGGAAAAGAAAWSALGGNRTKQSRVVLKSRSSQEVEAFWDIPAEERQAMRQQGGEKLALRLYDVTDIDLSQQPAHSVQQFDCDELTQRQRLPIALPDRDYLAEIGYLTPDNQWLSLARSTHVRVPAASNFLGNVAKTGGAAVAGGAVDSAKSVLSDDRDANAEPTIASSTEPQSANSQAPDWFQRITHRVGDATSDVTQAGNSAISGGTAAAAGAGAAAWSFVSGQRSPDVPRAESTPSETAFFTTGKTAEVNPVEVNPVDVNPYLTGEAIKTSLPTDIGEGRLVLTPRNSRWAYASWDLPRSLRSQLDHNTGNNLVLRLYDVTDAGTRLPSRYEQHDIDDMALSCDVPIPLSDRTYIAEVGYVDTNYQWSLLARSTPAYIPAS